MGFGETGGLAFLGGAPSVLPGAACSTLFLRGAAALTWGWLGACACGSGRSVAPASDAGRRLTVAVPFWKAAGCLVLGWAAPAASPLAAAGSPKPSGSLSRLLGRRLTVDDSCRVKSEPLGWGLLLRGRRFRVGLASGLEASSGA